jgi:PAS domain S-box-containing protein
VLLAIGRQLGAAIAKLRSEAALRENEEKYRTLSEQSLAGIQIIKDDRLIFVNDGWSKIVGYTRAEALSWEAGVFFKVVHPDDRAFFMEQVRCKQSGVTEGTIPVYDCRFISREGVTKWVLMHGKPVMFADGWAIVGVLVEITDRKLAEQALADANRQLKASEEQLLAANWELSAANREKEILLKEIHHRVKNNLQVVSSLLNLQLGHIQDAAASAVFRECQNRIKSIAIVHEKLYQSRNLANIDLEEYIRSLIGHLFQTFLVDPAAIRLDIAVDQVALDIEQAIPCCLIINELVTNALKYAFPDKKAGAISVVLKADAQSGGRTAPSQYLLVVSDNGVGFPSGVDFRNTASLGLQLVMTFVEQLGGTISLDTRQGTVFSIRFSETTKA